MKITNLVKDDLRFRLLEQSYLRGFDVLAEFSIDTAGMALDDDVEVECAVGRGHRLYSDRGLLACPCHWPAAKVERFVRALRLYQNPRAN